MITVLSNALIISFSDFRPGAHSMQEWATDPEKDRLAREKEAEEEDEKIDKDDPEALRKARQWDEYRDGNYFPFLPTEESNGFQLMEESSRNFLPWNFYNFLP